MKSTRWPLGLTTTAIGALVTAFACSPQPSSIAGSSADATANKDSTKQSAGSSGGADSSGSKGSATQGNGLPCDVSAILVKNCQSCHGSKPSPGAEHTLITWDDLQMVHDDGDKIYQAVEEKIHATTDPMPPSAPLTPAEMKVIDDWVAGGAKKSNAICNASSGPPPSASAATTADAGPPKTGCTSSSQCSPGQMCHAGECMVGCASNNDCPGNASCTNGMCSANGQMSGGCATDIDCPQDAPLCFNQQCIGFGSSSGLGSSSGFGSSSGSGTSGGFGSSSGSFCFGSFCF
jgi:hypothetical protein